MIVAQLAADIAESSGDLPPWLSFGVTPVVVLGLLLAKVIVPGWAYKQAIEDRAAAIAERDKAIADRDKLSEVMTGEVIPLATRQQDLLKILEPRIAPAVTIRDSGP